jgi:hypothetical protein
LTRECEQKLKAIEDDYFYQAEVMGIAKATAEQILHSHDIVFRSPTSVRNLSDVMLSPLADRPLSPPPFPFLFSTLPSLVSLGKPFARVAVAPTPRGGKQRSDKGKQRRNPYPPRERMGNCSNCGGKRALSNLQVDPFEPNNNSLFCRHCLVTKSDYRSSEERAWDEVDREAKEFVECSDFEGEDSQ